MNRVSDYVGRAIWLAGIGYIVLWPLNSLDHDGPFAASLICLFAPLAFLCHASGAFKRARELSPPFHAGGFADVFKHAVLCRILHYLREKPAAFRVIATHAGAGLYDLTGPGADRGGEWHDGIEKLMAAPLPAPVAALLAPYLEVVGPSTGAAGSAFIPARRRSCALGCVCRTA
jgi:hypothetical protein